MAEKVNVENFVRAETDRMFVASVQQAGGVDRWFHHRTPADIAHQTVIRMNRDTLYSAAVIDISAGATIGLPDAGDRYLSAMVVNQDHYINRVLHEPGDHRLTVADYDTPFVLVAVRTLVDPQDPADVVAVNALQDRMSLAPGAGRPFAPPVYDAASLDATRSALLELSRGLARWDGAFGTRETVDPVKHLLGSASGWGGLPVEEAYYLNVDPGFPDGIYRLTVRDVPVDAFWSVSVYNAEGYFEPNPLASYSLNSVTGTKAPDGSTTIQFGGCDGAVPNCIPIMPGWNYAVRLYRPRAEVLDGSWTFPTAVPIG